MDVTVIAYLSGACIARWQQAIVVQTGGIGYCVYVPDPSAFSDDTVSVWVHHHWSQEQGATLYGFSSQVDLHVFGLLVEAQGVGPRLALQCLAALPASSLVGALVNEDTKTLSSVPGIGEQKAKKIAFQLRDKAQNVAQRIEMPHSSNMQTIQDVRAALLSLGYNQREIEQAVSAVDVAAEERFDTLLRKALSQLVQ